MYRRKIIIDTDPGHDDALAMMLLVRSGLFDIKAVEEPSSASRAWKQILRATREIV